MNQDVDTYLDNLNHWQKELTKLRHIIVDCGLIEEFKWKHPCYTYNKKNILLIHGFKEYCALLFNKGVLLNDLENILIQQTENTQSARQIRFKNLSEIIESEPVIKAYIYEAIEVEKAGLQVKFKKTSDFEIPLELTQIFTENSELEIAFNSLTEGRKRGYLLHFTKPKKSASRRSRIEKLTERILDGYGLHDCVCGLSKRMPNCDGSHNQLKN